MDHTADIGLEVEAPSREELFRRAALGALWLALERLPTDRSETREIRISDPEPIGLLRAWVREFLFWQEVEGFAAAEVEVTELTDRTVSATVTGGPVAGDPVREIKGVTWHGLVMEPRREGWFARVIFDV
jgi:SHS2 domain-containing protein